MAKPPGCYQRGAVWYVRIIVPPALVATFGRSRIVVSLGTSDRKEAYLLATLKRAEWGADFESKRCSLNATPAEAITPEMGTLLADLGRAQVLAADDRVRHDVGLLAAMVHVRGELKRRSRNSLIIPRWDLPEPRIDDLSGATEEERWELADLNAYLDGNAALALAGGNLKAVMPLVQEHARSLGVTFDAQTPGAREALRLCLQAYFRRTVNHKTAHTPKDLHQSFDLVNTMRHPSHTHFECFRSTKKIPHFGDVGCRVVSDHRTVTSPYIRDEASGFHATDRTQRRELASL